MPTTPDRSASYLIYLHGAIVGDEDVGGLDVAMDDAGLMSRGEPLAGLLEFNRLFHYEELPSALERYL